VANQVEVKRHLRASQNKLAGCQRELKSKISDIKAGQSEFKETLTDTVDRWLKGIMAVAKQEAEILRKEFSSELQVKRQHIEVTRQLESTCWEFNMQVAAVRA
jgi:ElaB/YqjD/DUF883 family membrane-anchored ribosome-binding protein